METSGAAAPALGLGAAPKLLEPDAAAEVVGDLPRVRPHEADPVARGAQDERRGRQALRSAVKDGHLVGVAEAVVGEVAVVHAQLWAAAQDGDGQVAAGGFGHEVTLGAGPSPAVGPRPAPAATRVAA